MTEKIYDLRERTYHYALRIIGFLEKLSRDYISQVIAKQIIRSATSIGANVVEAKASSSRKDFTQFYTYSLKSANETKFWLSLIKDSSRVSQEEVAPILREAEEIANVLASCLLTLKGKKKF